MTSLRLIDVRPHSWYHLSAGVHHGAAAPPGGDGSGGRGAAAGVRAGPVDPAEPPGIPWRRGVSVFPLAT